jgi:hypothetical protein
MMADMHMHMGEDDIQDTLQVAQNECHWEVELDNIAHCDSDSEVEVEV